MRVTVTGANGALASVLRPRLLARGFALTSTGFVRPEPAGPDEQVQAGDLRDDAVVDAALAGAQVVLHLAGSSVERPLPEIIQNNLLALQRVYEGARRHRVGRVVFASSNHTIGMYPVGVTLTLSDPVRPDSFYGLSKVWGEAMGRMYWDKYGIETVAIRIGSALERPTETRHLSTWLGYEDLETLVCQALSVPDLGFLTVWGVSANSRGCWDNAAAAALGYAPQQNAEDYADTILAAPDASWPCQGGSFAAADLP
jgi:uronate dehydrogenase